MRFKAGDCLYYKICKENKNDASLLIIQCDDTQYLVLWTFFKAKDSRFAFVSRLYIDEYYRLCEK
jgi:hypothetical protein